MKHNSQAMNAVNAHNIACAWNKIRDNNTFLHVHCSIDIIVYTISMIVESTLLFVT